MGGELEATPPFWRTFGAHHVASAVATAVDFSAMVALVEWAHLSPPAATAFGALLGGLTNFAIGRIWTYRSTGRAHHELARYAVVSLGSLGLNALGVYLGEQILGSHYVLIRAIVAGAVSMLWNFPMQRGFVFRQGANAP